MVHSGKILGAILPVEGHVKLDKVTPSWARIFSE